MFQMIRDKIKRNAKLLENQTKKWYIVGGINVWRTDGFLEFK
jgi:hypothetical protein